MSFNCKKVGMTLSCTSGILEKAVKLLRLTVEFDSNSTVAQKQVWQPSPKFHKCMIVFLIDTMNDPTYFTH